MRIGIFGGTFDPPHIGHRLLALDVCEELGLDRLFVVPAGTQPFKLRNPPVATPEQRLQMARLAFADDPIMAVDEFESRRGGLSYTVDTVEYFAKSFPGAELVLLMGRDNYEVLDKWKRPERIRELCRIAVLERGISAGKIGDNAVHVNVRRIDVSSTEIRERVRAGKTISGLVPATVERYIKEKGLYK